MPANLREITFDWNTDLPAAKTADDEIRSIERNRDTRPGYSAQFLGASASRNIGVVVAYHNVCYDTYTANLRAGARLALIVHNGRKWQLGVAQDKIAGRFFTDREDWLALALPLSRRGLPRTYLGMVNRLGTSVYPYSTCALKENGHLVLASRKVQPLSLAQVAELCPDVALANLPR